MQSLGEIRIGLREHLWFTPDLKPRLFCKPFASNLKLLSKNFWSAWGGYKLYSNCKFLHGGKLTQP